MKNYEKLQMEVVSLNNADVLTTSGNEGCHDHGNGKSCKPTNDQNWEGPTGQKPNNGHN